MSTATASTPFQNSNPIPAPSCGLPTRPRLALRVGFAGRQELTSDESTKLSSALNQVFQKIGHRLAAIAPGIPVESGKEPRVSKFYAKQCPRLQLVTGLCQGADALAWQTLKSVEINPEPGKHTAGHCLCLEKELGAVLPFDLETYRRSRPPEFQAEFDQQLTDCAWVLTLDGHYNKPAQSELDTITDDMERGKRSALAEQRRSRAYRSQAAFLLRQSDLLIAAANPSVKGKAGGTLETVREAQIFDLPVVFIHTVTGAVHLIEPGDDLHSVLATEAAADWDEGLVKWVNQLTSDPDRDINTDDHQDNEHRKFGEQLLTEYFDQKESPTKESARLMVRLRKRSWEWFEKFFSAGSGPKSDAPLAPYDAYRKRATVLNYHYSGSYRGAFLLNYVLAILAIMLATTSLALLGKAVHSGVAGQVADLSHAAVIDSPQAPRTAAPVPPALMPALLVLAVVKLAILIFISRNTTTANHEKWNDRAVDLRYLAERLRAMYYLPRLGIQQPPAASPPQFASRAVRQSAIDWLFDALTRASSPADLPAASDLEIPSHDGTSTLRVRSHHSFDAHAEVTRIRDSWIAAQTHYHERNTRTYSNLHHCAETAGKWLGRAVICIVTFDVLFIVAEILDKQKALPENLSHSVHAIAPFIPWLVVLTAVVPAIVASIGGIRFQSECQRLAERSAVLRVLLGGRVDSHKDRPPSAFWPALFWHLKRFITTTWLVIRHLFHRAPAPPPTLLTGGRWQEADLLAKRIANARSKADSDPASWSHDALRLAERTAGDFVQEVAEWSVLYSKEVIDPG